MLTRPLPPRLRSERKTGDPVSRFVVPDFVLEWNLRSAPGLKPLFEKINVWLIAYSSLLHRLAQIVRSSECFRLIERTAGGHLRHSKFLRLREPEDLRRKS